jgi:hypothetical protein
MGGKIATLVVVLVLCLVGAPGAAAASTKSTSAPARPAASARAAAPQLSRLTLDEAHGLLYGSDTTHGAVLVFSVPALTQVATIDVGATSQPIGIGLSADGATLAVARTNRAVANIALIDTTTRAVTATLTPSSGIPWAVRFGRAGRLYSVGFPVPGLTDGVHVWDLVSHTEVGHSAPTADDATDAAITADGNSLYESQTTAAGIRLARFDISTDTPSASGTTPAVTFGGAVAVKPDGSLVYNSNGEVWSTDLTTRVGTLPGAGTSQAVAYAAGGNKVVTAVQPANTTELNRADGTTFVTNGTRHMQQSTALAVNGAGTVAFVATLTNVEAVPFAAPDSPTAVNAVAGIGSAFVSWTPPADTGTFAITGYDVISSGGAQVTVGPSVTSAVVTGLTSAPHTFVVDAVNASGSGPLSLPSNSVSPEPGGTFHTLSPTRILDTRSGLGAAQAPVGPGASLTVKVAGQGGVPLDPTQVSAVVVNVTVVDTTAPSFLTIFPSGVQKPLVSNLNWVAGQTVPNLVTVALGSSGQVTIFNAAGQTDVIFDVAGWVGTSLNSSGRAGMFNALAPSRLLDTRTDPGGPVGPGATRSLQVTGRGGVPASGVSAVVLNVTVTGPTAASFVTVWPAGDPQPVASNLNFVAGQTRPNRVMVKVSASGMVNIFNLAGSAQVVVDVGGWYTDDTTKAGGSGLVGTSPSRFFDSREPTQLGRPMQAGETLRFTLNDPRQITALIFNVTAVDATAPTFLTLFPDTGQAAPLASDVNVLPGEAVPNLAVVALSGPSNGSFDVFNAMGGGQVDVILDVDGFYGGAVKPLTAQVITHASEVSPASRVATPGGRTAAPRA